MADLDAIIVGAGPAGMTAAIWCSDLGLSSVVFEKEAEKGGQLLHIYNCINNYPGCTAVDGRDLRDRFLESVSKSDARFLDSTDIVHIDGESMSVRTKGGEEFFGKCVIFAAGVRRRRLNVAGESEFAGKGILGSGAKEKNDVADKTVAIIGGGDAALENALILSENAMQVYVIHRRPEFRARKDFIASASERPNIKFVFDTTVREINGAEVLESLLLKDGRSKGSYALSVDRLLVRIGVEPNSELLRDLVTLDDAGYIIVDRVGRTDRPFVYAVGDVANPISPTIATAVGSAAAAVKDIAFRLSR